MSCAIGEFPDGTPGCDQHLDDARVDHRTASRHLANGADQLVDVGHALFQQIGATACALLEERERVLGLRVLAQDDDAHGGPLRPQALRGAKALVSAGRWHADVRDDHLGVVLLDGSLEIGKIDAARQQLDFFGGLEELPDAFAEQVVILGEHHTDRHGMRIGERPGSGCLPHHILWGEHACCRAAVRLPLESWEKSR